MKRLALLFAGFGLVYMATGLEIVKGEDGPKVVICHIPPGNPDNAHAIEISVNALPAHLAHGDSVGDCNDCDDDDCL